MRNKKGFFFENITSIILIIILVVSINQLVSSFIGNKENPDPNLEKITDVANNIKIIKTQYIHKDEKKYDIQRVKLPEINEKYDGYFINIDKEYSIIKDEDQELVLLGVSGKFDEIKNKNERDNIKNDLCPRLFRSLISNDIILYSIALSNNLNNIVIPKTNKDYCKLIDKKEKVYLILDSKLINEEE